MKMALEATKDTPGGGKLLEALFAHMPQVMPEAVAASRLAAVAMAADLASTPAAR